MTRQIEDSVLATLAADTVRLLVRDGENQLLWTTWVGGSLVERWQSLSIFYAIPREILLDFINPDSLPDLFWTIGYEEIVGGMVLFGTRTGAREVFATQAEECDEPVIQDVNGDGLRDVVEYRPGAFSFDDCNANAFVSECLRTYPTDWRVAWIQTQSGFSDDPSLATAFYAQQRERYLNAARRLRALLQTSPDQLPYGCDAELAQSLDSLANEAGRLSQVR